MVFGGNVAEERSFVFLPLFNVVRFSEDEITLKEGSGVHKQRDGKKDREDAGRTHTTDSPGGAGSRGRRRGVEVRRRIREDDGRDRGGVSEIGRVGENETETLLMTYRSSRRRRENRCPRHRWLSKQRDSATLRHLSSGTWDGLANDTASSRGRLTTGTEQRGGA